MSEEEKEVVKEVHVPDESFVNTLASARKKQGEAEHAELQQLAQRLSILQQRLDQAKEKIKRDKALHEVQLIERVVMNTIPMFNVDDMEIRQRATALSLRSMDLLNQVLDREFSGVKAESK